MGHAHATQLSEMHDINSSLSHLSDEVAKSCEAQEQKLRAARAENARLDGQLRRCRAKLDKAAERANAWRAAAERAGEREERERRRATSFVKKPRRRRAGAFAACPHAGERSKSVCFGFRRTAPVPRLDEIRRTGS